MKRNTFCTMKKIRFTLAMMALVLCSLTVNAHDFEVDGVFYNITDSTELTVEVTYEGANKYNPDSHYTGKIRIPDHVNYYGRRYTVTRIGERAFMNCDSLISVSLPESIERIEEFAFDGCRNLTEIKMPSKANHIGFGAFNSCKQLEAIRIPEGVTILYYTTFWDCNNLKSIILPNSLTTIENGVFVDCDSLSTITFPDSLVKIGNYTFGYCDALDSITIPASVTDIGTEPFGYCNNLKSLQVAEGNPKYDSRDNCNAIIETATNKLAVGCAATIIPEGITTLGTYAFSGIYLPKIVLPNSIQAIEEMAIRECTLQSPLIIPDGVKRMDEYALCYNTVDSIIIRGQISRIEKNTFDGCTSTDVIDLPESVEYIGDGAFARCASLNKLICRAATPPQCGSRAFDGMNRNSTLEVPEESVSLYENANGWKSFLNIKSIGSTDVVELPDSNRNIVKKGHGTYYATEDGECTYLFSYDYNAYIERLDSTECFKWYGWNPIVIDVDTIGPNAFVGCSFNNGQVIYLTEKVKVICKDAFTRINIRSRMTDDGQITDNLTLVFEGAKPPRIADNKIMDYTSNSCYINFIVPDLETYIKSDLQWTYTQIMTVDDLLYGKISAKNRIKVLETSEADVVVDFDKLAPSGAPMLYATVRPRKKVSVRIGTDGDTIYSPAPVWQNYKMQVQVVNDDGRQYFGGEWECGANEQRNLTIELYSLPNSNYVYFVSRGINEQGTIPNWARTRVDLTPQNNSTKRGYGIYHGDSYLYRYTIDESKEVTDSTDFARWYDKTVIYFDVDTIGTNAFSGATFRQGQILYFTERLNTIFKDAFTGINIIKRTSQESLMSDDLTLVFAGANPPGIDKNHIMDYADSTYHINYVVPDLETYIKDDIQWTYTTLMTIDDFVQGYVSPENEVTVNDSTETNVSLQPGTNQDGNIDLVVHARPRKEIPVRIGEGENKDIYSRAPAWMRYTMELRITDSEGTELYAGEMQCSAYGECQFNVSFACPANKIIHIYTRSIDMFGRATEWAITTINLDTSISPIVAPNTDAPYYDLQGRPVAHPTRGIYIRNGRKVVM